MPDPGELDDGPEASSAPQIMVTSAALGVTGRRQPPKPIPIGIIAPHTPASPGSPMLDGAGAGPIVHAQTMHVSETHMQMPAPSPNDVRLIIDRLAATELQNHQLQLQLAQTLHAIVACYHMRQFGSAPPSVSMPSQTVPALGSSRTYGSFWSVSNAPQL
jgi:hypothetical protein